MSGPSHLARTNRATSAGRWAYVAALTAAVSLGSGPLGTPVVGPPSRAWSQSADLELKPRWNAGDRRTVSVERHREDTRPGRGTSRSGSRADVTINVVEQRSDGYLVRWAFGPVHVHAEETGGEEQRLLQEALAGLLAGLVYELEVDTDGLITGLRNWTELKARGEQALANVMDALRRRGLPDGFLGQLRSQVQSLFASEEQLLTYGIREPRLYHSIFGRSYRMGSPVTQEVSLPSPLGAGAIPGRWEGTLRSLDRRVGRAVIDWRNTTDPATLDGYVKQTMRDLAAQVGKPAVDVDGIRVRLSDTGQYTADTRSGWITTVTHVRKIVTSRGSETATRVETMALREKP